MKHLLLPILTFALLSVGQIGHSQATLVLPGLIQAPTPQAPSPNLKKAKTPIKGKSRIGKKSTRVSGQSTPPPTSNFSIVSAESQSSASSGRGGRGGGTGGSYYLVNRNADQYSTHFQNAAQTGRAFGNATINYTSATGQYMTIQLTNVALVNYNTGGTSGVESFHLIYQSENITTN